MNATFVDFDGVIADSIEETFIVSLKVFYGFAAPQNLTSVRRLFFEHRGLVGPPHHFHALHTAIDSVLQSGSLLNHEQFHTVFLEAVESCESHKETFECLFFGLRKHLQQDKTNWLSLNPLTDYGQSLVGRDLKNHFIITTKDEVALDLLLSAYNIDIKNRFTKSDYEYYGSKGSIINEVLKSEPQYHSAIFIDDSVEHLNSVDNQIVTCYFAPWGYGTNTMYEEFAPEKW